jgi:hypothetical protein
MRLACTWLRRRARAGTPRRHSRPRLRLHKRKHSRNYSAHRQFSPALHDRLMCAVCHGCRFVYGFRARRVRVGLWSGVEWEGLRRYGSTYWLARPGGLTSEERQDPLSEVASACIPRHMLQVRVVDLGGERAIGNGRGELIRL